MTILKTMCTCGEKVTVRTGDDAKTRGRKYQKQVVYTGDERMYGEKEYDIFRCRGCGEPINETCKAAEYGE